MGVQEHTSLWPAPSPSHLIHLRSQRNALRSALAECGGPGRVWSRDGSSYSQEDFGQAVVLSQAGGQLFISVLGLGLRAPAEVSPWGNCSVWHQTPPPSVRARWGVPLPSFPHSPYLILQESLPPKPPVLLESSLFDCQLPPCPCPSAWSPLPPVSPVFCAQHSSCEPGSAVPAA